jgi:hypothetical protein
MHRTMISDALTPTATEGRSTLVKEFLRRALADGPVSVAELEQQARAIRLLGPDQSATHAKVFKRVKRHLGIRSIRTGFGQRGEWVWDMPTSPVASKAAADVTAEIEPPDTYGEDDASQSAAEAITLPGPAVAVSIPDCGGEAPGDWALGVARLDGRRPVGDVPVLRWGQFVDDCNAFVGPPAAWARRAADLGWDAIALFGCSRTQPLGHLGMAGLIWAINGDRLTRLHADWAEIEGADRERQTYHRRRVDPARVTLPWDLR